MVSPPNSATLDGLLPRSGGKNAHDSGCVQLRNRRLTCSARSQPQDAQLYFGRSSQMRVGAAAASTVLSLLPLLLPPGDENEADMVSL